MTKFQPQELPKYYSTLFNGVTDALAALEQQNYGAAREILVRAQQSAEEAYIEGTE